MRGPSGRPEPSRSVKVRFRNPRGQELAGLLDGSGGHGVVICSHFTGFKEEKLAYYLARSLAGKNFLALRFDYGDCVGESGGSCESMSVSRQIEDTQAAVDFLKSRGAGAIGLFGHSLGGLTALAAAVGDPRVRALVTAAASAGPDRDDVFQQMASKWREQGYMEFPVWRRGSIRIPYAFYRDWSEYDGAELIRELNVPIRIIHPEQDKIVGLGAAMRLYANAREPRDLQIIPEAGHLFSSADGMDSLLSLTLDWFLRYLSPKPESG